MTDRAPSSSRLRILLGRITGAHGIRGDVIVHSFAANPEDIAAYGALSDESGQRQFKLKLVGGTSKGLIARIAGIVDRNAAEALRGTDLYIARDKLPAANPNEFYHVDLIGLDAVSPEGHVLGRIVGVPNYGAGDLIEIELTGKAKAATELIPFNESCVPTIDFDARRVVVVLPVAAADDPADGEPSRD